MKKIAFGIPSMIIGGVESVFIRTLEELSKNPDLEISVIMQSEPTEPIYRQWFFAHPKIKKIQIYPLLNWFQSMRKYTKVFPLENIRKIIFSLYKKTKRLQIKQIGISEYDLFIDYKNFAFSKELKQTGTKYISWFHGSINFFNDDDYIRYLDNYYMIIGLSNSFVEDFKETYPKYRDKVMHLYNPINTETIRARANDGDAPIYDGTYFCCVSRHDSDKDIKTVIRAFDAFWAKENQPDIKMLFVGDGPCHKELKKYAAQMKSAKNIIFSGSVPNPFGYMKNSVAHILSSNNEGLPTVLIEAQALGVLNIASNCKSGTSEILLDGAGGLLFTPGNAEQLADQMSDVWNNKIDKKSMIKASSDGLARFESGLISKQIQELIYSITKD